METVIIIVFAIAFVIAIFKVKKLEKNEVENMKNENQNEEQRIDLRTMQPIGEEKEQYMKEYEKEQLRQRDERISQIYNAIANILKFIGWIVILVGFIGGIILGRNIYEYGHYEFNYVAMLITWLSCGISAILFFALGEIIQILHDIRLKVYTKIISRKR